MTKRPEYRLVNRLRVFASSVAISTAATGLSGRAGWTLHVASLSPCGAAPGAMLINRRPTLFEATKSAAPGSL